MSSLRLCRNLERQRSRNSLTCSSNRRMAPAFSMTQSWCRVIAVLVAKELTWRRARWVNAESEKKIRLTLLAQWYSSKTLRATSTCLARMRIWLTQLPIAYSIWTRPSSVLSCQSSSLRTCAPSKCNQTWTSRQHGSTRLWINFSQKRRRKRKQASKRGKITMKSLPTWKVMSTSWLSSESMLKWLPDLKRKSYVWLRARFLSLYPSRQPMQDLPQTQGLLTRKLTSSTKRIANWWLSEFLQTLWISMRLRDVRSLSSLR